MNDTKRPQLTPEVVESDEVQSAVAVEAPDRKEAEQVRQPLPKPVARPIVEVVGEIQKDAVSTEQVRQPLPKPVARPIVEVVAEIRHNAKGADSGKKRG